MTTLKSLVASVVRIRNEHIHTTPRRWSNVELKRIAPLFTGSVCNVSAWEDQDKEGSRYRDYFTNASDYSVTNYKANMRGMSGLDGEIFLDLESELPPALINSQDVIFNHTTLEHVYEFRLAFANLCRMSREAVIVVVPFLQQVHVVPTADNPYSDYWRFTPHAIERLFEENGFEVAYLSFNSHRNASVYIFCVAINVADPNDRAMWQKYFPFQYSNVDETLTKRIGEPWAGSNALRRSPTREFFTSAAVAMTLVARKISGFFVDKVPSWQGR